jgi:hypothetical protein
LLTASLSKRFDGGVTGTEEYSALKQFDSGFLAGCNGGHEILPLPYGCGLALRREEIKRPVTPDEAP